MIYLLKFASSFILPPGIFIVVMAMLAVHLWHKAVKKPAVILGIITFIFYIACTNWFGSMLISSLENTYEQPANPQGDVIILLGGGATKDTPNMGEEGNLASSPTSRMLAALEIHNRLHVPILVSGGQVYEDSGAEAVLTKRELMRLGVKEEDIIVEGSSLNTRQNAQYSRELIEGYGFTAPILVTSAFHMERAVLNFQKEGLAVVAYPTDYHSNRQQIFHYNKLMPTTGGLSCCDTYLREKLRSFVTKHFE